MSSSPWEQLFIITRKSYSKTSRECKEGYAGVELVGQGVVFGVAGVGLVEASEEWGWGGWRRDGFGFGEGSGEIGGDHFGC